MKRKKNGFTLVELLITVALMLSILAIAIVSFINVGNRKKEEAWVAVKEQIETAAEEYFKSNEYLFEGMTNAGGSISVGKLVEEDYLNVVTDPRTGKPISYCAEVVFEKMQGAMKTYLDEENMDKDKPNCNFDNSLTITEGANPPELNIKKTCGLEGENNWCKIPHGNIDGAIITADVIPNGNSSIVNFYAEKRNDETCENGINSIKCIANKSTTSNGSEITFAATSNDGSSIKQSITYYLDMDKPEGNVAITSDQKYNSKDVKINGSVRDKTSGVSSVKISNNDASIDFETDGKLKSTLYEKLFDRYDGSQKTIKLKLTDKAGNTNEIESNKYMVYKECSETKVEDKYSYGEWSKCSKTCGYEEQTRERWRNLIDVNTGKNCGKTDEDKESKSCNNKECQTCPTMEIDYSKSTKSTTSDWFNTNVYFKVSQSTLNWHFLTDGCSGSKCVTLGGVKYNDWGKTNNTYVSSEGQRKVALAIEEDGKLKLCGDPISIKIDKTKPKIVCDSLDIKHRCDGKDRSGTYRSGSAIFNVKENGTVKHYNCPGYLTLNKYNCTITAKSGIKSKNADANATYNTNSGGCLITENENPCSATWKITATSNAGLTATYEFKFKDDYYNNGRANNSWYNKYYK